MPTWTFTSVHDDDGGPSDEEIWQRLRLRRNNALSSCDWTQVNDPTVDKAAWAQYRQALRDLPANTIDPREAVWPTPPK